MGSRTQLHEGMGTGMFSSDFTGNFFYQLGVNLKQKIDAVSMRFPPCPRPDGSIPLMKCTQFILPTLIT